MTLTLPIPPRALSPNGPQGLWRKKAKAKAEARNIAKLITLSALGGHPAPSFTRYTLTFYHKTNQRRDDDNLSAMFKSYRDGIADALRIDDNTLRMAESPTSFIDPKKPRLEVTLLP